jgi:hypothetical protein
MQLTLGLEGWQQVELVGDVKNLADHMQQL